MNEIQEKDSDSPVQVKVCRLAVEAIICAVLGPALFFISFILYLVRSPLMNYFTVIATIGICISVIGLMLGVISFIKIEISGGRVTGRNFAVLSIILPVFAGLFLIIYSAFLINRSTSYSIVCSTNLAGIGKAMLIYANDYEDEFPRAGGKDSTWGTSVNWKAATRQKAYGINNDGTGGSPTISSSLYLLVKYTDIEPKRFICSQDRKVSEFCPESVLDRIKKKTGIGKTERNDNILSYWDFGSESWKHNSYSYHMPYGENPLTTSTYPDMAIAADRNPWIPSPGWEVKDFFAFDPDGDKNFVRNGNNPCHQYEGQSVLFVDCHVSFKIKSFCGRKEDNIYTSWNGSDIRKGTPPKLGSQSASHEDSLLVNDSPVENP